MDNENDIYNKQVDNHINILLADNIEVRLSIDENNNRIELLKKENALKEERIDLNCRAIAVAQRVRTEYNNQ